MKSLKDSFLFFIGIAFIFLCFYLVLQSPAPERYQETELIFQTEGILKLKEKEILVEIADTQDEIVRGLSGRNALESGTGMIFLFSEPGEYGFWMREMNFPIDILWLNENWSVISMEKGVSPESYPHVFYPNGPAMRVVELPKGEVERLGIQIGDMLEFKDLRVQ